MVDVNHVVWKSKPKLVKPTMIVAFEGWNDAGDAASTAARHLRDRFAGNTFATLDPEYFYDFSTSRPYIKLSEDGTRHIEWPETSFAAISATSPPKHEQLELTDLGDEQIAQDPNDELSGELSQDLIVVVGSEPQLKWRTYTEQILAIAEEFDVQMVVTLGSLIAEVVHTRPATIYSAGYDKALIERLDLEPSNYEGPTGIIGVLHQALSRAGFSSVSLWATVPSYVPNATSPKAALALVERVSQLLDLTIPTSALEIAAVTYVSQISELVAEDEEAEAYVADLEKKYDDAMKPESSAELIRQVEEYLRDGQDD